MSQTETGQTEDEEGTGPEPGTWADVARMMRDLDPGFDWDSWKDEMKEQDL